MKYQCSLSSRWAMRLFLRSGQCFLANGSNTDTQINFHFLSCHVSSGYNNCPHSISHYPKNIFAVIFMFNNSSCSQVAGPMCPVLDPAMVTTVNFFHGNVFYMASRVKLAWLLLARH